MTPLDVREAFARLPSTIVADGSGKRFAAIQIPHFERYRVARDGSGAPALLISSDRGAIASSLVPVQLENLQVQHRVECHITRIDGKNEEGLFSIVQCTSPQADVRDLFLRFLSPMIQKLGSCPASDDVTRAIDQLVDLFSLMALPPRKSVQGLWAELFLIVRSGEPETVVEAWHNEPQELYDFCMGQQRIEAKSTSRGSRSHYFRFEQLIPPASTSVLVASLFVERAGAGVSIGDLIEKLQSQLRDRPDLIMEAERIVAMTLGDSWGNAMRDRFDYELAEESLRFFSASAVPSINQPLQHGVSHVSFLADLTDKEPKAAAWMRDAGGLFKAIQPTSS